MHVVKVIMIHIFIFVFIYICHSPYVSSSKSNSYFTRSRLNSYNRNIKGELVVIANIIMIIILRKRLIVITCIILFVEFVLHKKYAEVE